MAKEQHRQELVPAVGHGKKNGEKEIVVKKIGDDGVHNPLQIPLKVCFGPHPHGF
jgi:hypothetical protein